MAFCLFDDFEFLAHFDEGGDAAVQLVERVPGGYLHPDAGLPLGHDRVVESRHEDPLVLQFRRKILRQLGIVEHDRTNRRLRRLDVEPGRHHLRAEVFHIDHKPVVQFVALFQHPEHLDSGAHHGRGQRIREQIGARTLAQHIDNLLAARREAAHRATERLAQRTRQNIHLAAQVVQLRDSAARFAQHACRMAFVDHHQRVVFLSQLANFVERRGIAVHREHAVGADDAEPLGLRFLETLLQLGHVGVGIAITHRLAQTHAVDNRRVVQRIRYDSVLLGQQRLENAPVRIEASRIENRILGPEVIRNRLFELLVDVLAAADETHRRHAETPGVHRFLGRLDQPGIVRQAQVVVRTEVQHFAARNLDFGTLGRLDDPFRLVEPGSLDFGQLVLQVFLDVSVHGNLCFLFFVFPTARLRGPKG